MVTDKKTARLRRAQRVRAKIKELRALRLCVNRTPRHIYAQIIDASGAKVLVSASTLDSTLKGKLKGGGNIAAASMVGEIIAEKAKQQGIAQVAFDRSGFKYHGRVKALADAAREHGLKF